ncbi:MAG: hypothetical protein GKR89_19175 [Candidatus Latescibacteria bacterium]|nr:hypothetical protein [Candidatus Latescibacterota bacterium]
MNESSNANLVRVVSNAAVDVLVRDVEETSGPAQDGWGSNVQLLDRPTEVALGGNGAAVAYVLGKLGQRVQLNANVGVDAWGGLVRGWLQGAGVEVVGEAAHSAVNVIALSSEGKRRSMYYTGDKVDWEAALEGPAPGWFFAAGYGQADGDDLELLVDVFAVARRRGSRVCFDPSPWFWGRAEKSLMLKAWSQVDCLVGTEEELGAWAPAAGPEDLARSLLDLGPEIAVVKRGAEGAVCAGRDVRPLALPTEPVESANTVGAGDTFNGRLLFGLATDEILEDAVHGALRLATQVVRRGRGVLGAF